MDIPVRISNSAPKMTESLVLGIGLAISEIWNVTLYVEWSCYERRMFRYWYSVIAVLVSDVSEVCLQGCCEAHSWGTQPNDESELDRWVWGNIGRQTARMEDGTSPTALEITLMDIKLAMRIFCVVSQKSSDSTVLIATESQQDRAKKIIGLVVGCFTYHLLLCCHIILPHPRHFSSSLRSLTRPSTILKGTCIWDLNVICCESKAMMSRFEALRGLLMVGGCCI